MIISILWPVWTDGFAYNEKRKATWMSCFLASSPIGVLFGYVLTTQLILNYNWKYAFYVQAVAVVPAIILVLVIPKRYFSLKKLGPHIDNDNDFEESRSRQLDLQSEMSSDRPQNSVREQMRSSHNRDAIGASYDTD